MSISLILQTLLSTAAVMATVLVILFVVTGIGLLTSFSWQQAVGVRIRSAIWLGWFWVAVYVSTAHLFFAMKPPVAVPLIIAGLIGWFLLIRKSGFPHFKLRGQPWWIYGAWAALFALFVLLSNQTLRDPGVAADTGGYHVPYSAVAAISGVIPGIAHLNPYFGYAGQIVDLISAQINTITFSQDSFRLITLFIVSSVVLDIFTRLSSKSKPIDQGSRQPAVYMFLVLIFILLLSPWSSIWLSSLKVDIPALIFVLLGIGYALAIRPNAIAPNLLVSLASLMVAAALRPAYLIFFLIPIVRVSLIGDRSALLSKPQTNRFLTLFLPFTLGSVILEASILLGNQIRTGFPLFPFSTWRLSVPDWTMPTSQAQAYIDYVQNFSISWVTDNKFEIPYVTPEVVIGALARDPAIQLALLGLVVWVVVLLGFIQLHRRGHTDGKIPSSDSRPLQTQETWFISATLLGLSLSIGVLWIRYPQPRYLWGFLIAISIIPISYVLSNMSIRRSTKNLGTRLVIPIAIAGTLLIIFLQTGYLGSALINPVSATGTGLFGANEPDIAPLRTFTSRNGVVTVSPTNGLCWATTPPCTFYLPPGPAANLEYRGRDWTDGFRLSR